jgi:hypothetical protein
VSRSTFDVTVARTLPPIRFNFSLEGLGSSSYEA